MAAGGFRAAAEEAADEADRVREHGERERSIRRGAVGSGPHDRDGDAQRRRALHDALRRLFRRRADSSEAPMRTRTSASACSKRFSSPRPRSTRAYEREGCSPPSTRCSTTTATRKAAPIRRRLAPTGRLPRCSRSATPSEDGLPSDPKLRALHLERRELERRVEALRLLKDSMDPARYSRSSKSWSPHRAQDARDSSGGREVNSELPSPNSHKTREALGVGIWELGVDERKRGIDEPDGE